LILEAAAAKASPSPSAPQRVPAFGPVDGQHRARGPWVSNSNTSFMGRSSTWAASPPDRKPTAMAKTSPGHTLPPAAHARSTPAFRNGSRARMSPVRRQHSIGSSAAHS
jgi:hypothetical protein